MIPWSEQHLKSLGRFGLMLLSIFILFALTTIPFKFGVDPIRPAFMLMAVYYWTVLRPNFLSPSLVFLLGLLLDLLAGFPLGMQALVLVAAQWITKSQRKFLVAQNFLMIWVGFALVALGAALLQWLLFTLFNFSWMPVKSILMSVLFSSCLFPVAAMVLAMIHKALSEDGD